jgi:cardiolipin synthase
MTRHTATRRAARRHIPRRHTPAPAVAVALAVATVFGLAACGTVNLDAPVGTASQYRLVQYPGAGFSDFYAQTAAAKSSIDMEMYELSDPREEAALIAARSRGVVVRVLLNSKYGARAANEPAFAALTAGGVSVRWASDAEIFHAKVTTFDGTTSDISTANLTSQYYATTRDAEIVDTNPAQVHAIEQTFESDWGGGTPNQGEADAPGLVWSPDSESTMVAFIHSAKSSVHFMSEELADPYISDALADDARNGVRCEIVMVDDPKWSKAFASVTAAGCVVHVIPNSPTGFYIHEKALLVDAGSSHASLLIGSQNASYSSLAFNRELSVILTEAVTPGLIAAVSGTFDHDFSAANLWRG